MILENSTLETLDVTKWSWKYVSVWAEISSLFVCLFVSKILFSSLY